MDHKQGLDFTRIQCKNSNYTLIREGLPISLQIQAHLVPTKINLPNSQGYGARFGFTILFFQIQKQNSFSMSQLPNCEKDYLKSFINILKAYGLDQQKESNIGVVESSRLET
jgi:hypothetical protein